MIQTASTTPEWRGGTRIDGPNPAVKKDGQPATRSDETFSIGTVWALSKETGEPAARLTFEVYEKSGKVLLGNADADGLIGGVDRRGEGAGRAMMDALEEQFPAPDWWFAADPADHSPEGLRLMLSRRKPGRQWVHSSLCEERKVEGCSCELVQRDHGE